MGEGRREIHDKKPPQRQRKTSGRDYAWQGRSCEAPCRTRALFGQGLEVDFHQALNRQDVGAHGAAQRFLGNTLIGAVHGADPLGVFVMRIFGAEARAHGNSRA